MGGVVHGLGMLMAALLPAVAAGWLVRRWRRDNLGSVVAVVVGAAAGWVGLGLWLRLVLGDVLAGMD